MPVAFVSPLPSWVLLLLLAVPLIGGIVYYLSLIFEIRGKGGRVGAQYFGMPDLFMGGTLAAYFAWGGLTSLSKGEAVMDMNPGRLFENALFMVAILGVVVAFAVVRRIPFFQTVGLVWNQAGASVFRSIVALGTALPIVWAVNMLFRGWFPDRSQEQAMVSVFRSASESGDWSTVWVVCFSAVIVAPVVEESLFRGYFYATLKRYFGPIASGLFTCALFALSHGNLSVMGGLFALSIGLTISYERHGSLWVSMGMHALFNTLSLSLLYFQGRGWIPS